MTIVVLSDVAKRSRTFPQCALAKPFALLFNQLADRLRVAGNRCRQRRELIEYLASDHRAANDLGITMYEARDLCR
jgi:hypothetical protein